MHTCSLHVIDSPACGCLHRVEDTAHFFLDCPLYYAQRLSLRNTVTRFSQFRLETLLYGDDDLDYESNVAIILAVHEFIKDSERFWLRILYVYISQLLRIDYTFHVKFIMYESFYYLTVVTIGLYSLVSECMVLYWWHLCECVVWMCLWLLSMLVQLYMLYWRGLQHSICALPNPFSCKWNKICLNQFNFLKCCR